MTGESYRKRGGIGPSVCHLCLRDEESIKHLFAECEEALDIWKGVCNQLKIKCSWKHLTVDENLKAWFLLHPKEIAVPFIVLWGIWLHQNKILF